MESFATFRLNMNLNDRWRDAYKTDRAYSYSQQSTGSHSRIDRIYASEPTVRTATDWEIKEVGHILTDHNMVSFHLQDEKAPL